jgi:hypothetical protein
MVVFLAPMSLGSVPLFAAMSQILIYSSVEHVAIMLGICGLKLKLEHALVWAENSKIGADAFLVS